MICFVIGETSGWFLVGAVTRPANSEVVYAGSELADQDLNKILILAFSFLSTFGWEMVLEDWTDYRTFVLSCPLFGRWRCGRRMEEMGRG
jgi:hypothetical protein